MLLFMLILRYYTTPMILFAHCEYVRKKRELRQVSGAINRNGIKHYTAVHFTCVAYFPSQ